MADIVTPDWVQDAVFYQIFPDTFAQSKRVPKPPHLAPWDAEPSTAFKGGDLVGIVEHLDYLQDLGVTALYLNPVFASTANHRYHTHDYHRVDPILGGDEALRELVDAAHGRGMRLILDGVFNHTGRSFYQFAHTLENGLSSPFLDWYHFNRAWLASGEPLDAYPSSRKQQKSWQSGGSLEAYGYRAWWDISALPKLNTGNPQVRAFLFDVAEKWLRFGTDGWRLDVPMEIDDDDFWREFRDRTKAVNPEAYLVGEIWEDPSRWLQGDQFDGTTNYELQRACLRYFGGDKLWSEASWAGSRITPWLAVRFSQEVSALLERFPEPITHAQLNVLGSHDTARILSQMSGDVARTKLAFLFLMTVPGVPCIYYGDEIGLANAGRLGDGARAAMIWQESAWNTELRDHVRRCVAMRKAHAALRRGSFEKLYANNQSNVYAYLRKLGREALVIVLNNGSEPWDLEVPIQAHLFAGVALENVLDPDAPEARVRERTIVGEPLAPQGGAVYRARLE